MTQQNNNNNTNIQCEWITIQQAMQLLQVTSRTSMYNFVYKHNVRASKPLGRVYYNVTDIMNVLDNCSVKMGL